MSMEAVDITKIREEGISVDEGDPEESVENQERARSVAVDFAREMLSKYRSKITEILEEVDISKENFRDIKDIMTGKDMVGADEAAIKILEIGGLFDKRIAMFKIVFGPLLEKELEINKRREEGEAISKTQEIKEKLGMTKETLKTIVPENTENDRGYIEGVGVLFCELGEKNEGKTKHILGAVGKILQNKNVQGKISNEFRSWLNKDTEEENIGVEAVK